MYSVNGISLENPARGWSLSAATKPLSEYTRDVQSLQRAGQDGVVTGLPSQVRPVTFPLVVNTPRVELESLIALFGSVGVLSSTFSPSREVTYEVVSTVYQSAAAKADEFVEYTFFLRLPGAFWRDKAETNRSWPVSGSSTVVEFWPGMSAPVQDAWLRLTGPHSGASVQDVSGAWVSFPACAAGESVVFRSDVGTAGKNTTGSWATTTDVSGAVDFGGPRGGAFEITPSLSPLNPASRTARLTVSGSIGAGASLAIRGEAAYAL